MLRQIEKLHATAQLFNVIKALIKYHETSRGSDTLELCDTVMNSIEARVRIR